MARANGAAAQKRPSIARINGQLDPRLQLANITTPFNHTRPSTRKHSSYGATTNEIADMQLQLTTHLSTLDESLSWPNWLTCGGRFTHISGQPSAAGRAQDRESSPAKERRYTTVPRNQRFLQSTATATFICSNSYITKKAKCKRQQYVINLNGFYVSRIPQ